MTGKLLWNCWIIANYLGAVAWWGWHGSVWNMAYWLCAAGITVVVTFGLQPA